MTRFRKYPVLRGSGDVYAFVSHVSETRDTRIVTIDCPRCGEQHVHGHPYPEVDEKDAHPGWRVPHCRNLAAGDYVVVLPRVAWKKWAR
ncbi:hypothetical protein [Curtobacterium flaccumfaciens]|uniref:hypothetical protein n=1 Tax=Curtobacterium flaccumfaciens TaxID=2035 RepID=UPI003995E331